MEGGNPGKLKNGMAELSICIGEEIIAEKEAIP